MKRRYTELFLLALLTGIAPLFSGCVVRSAYTVPAEETVVVESYPPRWYDGRWIYYRDGGWGYWVAGTWWAYPPSHEIYVVHHYPRRHVAYAHRPAPSHRVTAVRGRPHARSGRDVVVRSQNGHGRATVHSAAPHRRGDRVQAQQPQNRSSQNGSQVRRQTDNRGGSDDNKDKGRSSRGRQGRNDGSGKRPQRK